MKLVRDIAHDLREKRLWPIALLLVVLLAAVPMTLARPGAAPEVAAVPSLDLKPDGPQLSLTETDLTGFDRAPRVSTRSSDPFGDRTGKDSAALMKRLKDAADQAIGAAGGADSMGDAGSPSGDAFPGDLGGGFPSDPGTGTLPDGGSYPSDPAPTDPSTTPGTETVKDDVIAVLLEPLDDNAAEPTELADIRTLSPLPNVETPFMIYVGPSGEDRANFLVSSDVTVVSTSGTCAPSKEDCRTLDLDIGESVVITRPGEDGETEKVRMTLTALDAKRVAVASDDDSLAQQASFNAQARAVGARALKVAMKDRETVDALAASDVKIRKQ